MKIPMTPQEAIEKYECHECKQGGNCGMDCVRSQTCSMLCVQCGQRVYFSGDLWDAPATFNCPDCNAVNKNSYHRERCEGCHDIVKTRYPVEIDGVIKQVCKICKNKK